MIKLASIVKINEKKYKNNIFDLKKCKIIKLCSKSSLCMANYVVLIINTAKRHQRHLWLKKVNKYRQSVKAIEVVNDNT